jgi:hypothetical protein
VSSLTPYGIHTTAVGNTGAAGIGAMSPYFGGYRRSISRRVNPWMMSARSLRPCPSADSLTAAIVVKPQVRAPDGLRSTLVVVLGSRHGGLWSEQWSEGAKAQVTARMSLGKWSSSRVSAQRAEKGRERANWLDRASTWLEQAFYGVLPGPSAARHPNIHGERSQAAHRSLSQPNDRPYGCSQLGAAIIEAGGEPRRVRTLADYRQTAL